MTAPANQVASAEATLSVQEIAAFQERISALGRELYRDLPWRNVSDPYLVFLSEVMLQQTQVSRVEKKWPVFTAAFPTLEALAAAPLGFVLEQWQGMGYNRRAINLKHAAEAAFVQGGIPHNHAELLKLPGIGPSTAAGIRVFAFNEPDLYLETNVRSVFLHEFFPLEDSVPDAALMPLVHATCDTQNPRAWYYSLLDYGNYLKSTLPNPSRRSKTYARQSAFEGSHRQKRAFLLRTVLDAPGELLDFYTAEANQAETSAGRAPLAEDEVEAILGELEQEGFITHEEGRWFVLD